MFYIPLGSLEKEGTSFTIVPCQVDTYLHYEATYRVDYYFKLLKFYKCQVSIKMIG